MDLDDINAGLASQEVAQKRDLEEVEKVDEIDMVKDATEAIDHEGEKRLVRKLDLW
jgi:hypothetical protein